jgi:hypothetical protein
MQCRMSPSHTPRRADGCALRHELRGERSARPPVGASSLSPRRRPQTTTTAILPPQLSRRNSPAATLSHRRDSLSPPRLSLTATRRYSWFARHYMRVCWDPPLVAVAWLTHRLLGVRLLQVRAWVDFAAAARPRDPSCLRTRRVVSCPAGPTRFKPFKRRPAVVIHPGWGAVSCESLREAES